MTDISERTGITWVSQVVHVIFIILGLAYFLYFWGCFFTVEHASSHGIILCKYLSTSHEAQTVESTVWTMTVKLKISDNPWYSNFLSSLKETKDNRSAQPFTTKNIEAQVDQNASSKHDFIAQIDPNEKVVKLPNGFRTVWKNQSYCYATGKFEPIGLCTNEKPGRNNILTYIWFKVLLEVQLKS